MDKLFLTILNMSLTGAFVIAAICLARLLLKKAPKIISYCLWAVAGFRLVFPFSIESVFSLIPFKAQTIPTDIAMQSVPRIDSGIPFVNNAVSSILPAATPAASVNPLQIWTTIGAFVWFIGVAVMVVYGMVSFVILKRKMREAAHIKANIYKSENIKSPFVLGVFKPKIYLPIGMSENEKNYILLHEQTHIRRRDHIVKFTAYFILCVHWFNPLVWAAFLLMGVDMEMSCDERVLREIGGEIKRDYSLSLLSLATERRFISGGPLAFGEGGVKERIKNVLNFNKTSRVIIIAAVALAAVLSIGLAVNRTIGRDLSMQGTNLSDLQTEALIKHIVKVTGAKDEGIIIPPNNFQLNVSGNFDWIDSATISMLISKNKMGGSPYYACQLRIFSDKQNYFITEPHGQDAPDRQYLLRDYLNALKYLPQEHIQDLMSDNPDRYIINIVDRGIPDDNRRCVFYNMDGLTDNSGWLIRLDVQPLYKEAGGGYHGLGSDVVHVFYTDAESSTFSLTDGWTGNLNGKSITLEDVRTLAKKGDDLLFEDFQKYKGANVSSNLDYYIMVYGVEGGYRLIVRSDQSGKPDSANLESIWESGGSGIDIRYGDIDKFLSKWPIIMQVKDGTATPSGVTVTLKNVTETEYTYGESFTVQRKTDNGWIDVEPILDNYAFNDIGYLLPAMGSKEVIVDWEWRYGKLPAGDYRIAKEALFVRAPGDYDTFTLFAAFTIVK